jgi:hypothetical protein
MGLGRALDGKEQDKEPHGEQAVDYPAIWPE